MALLDAYGLSLVSVEVWGLLFGVLSSGFIVGGLVVARRGLGANPLRTLLVVNVVMWAVSSVFTLRSSIVLLARRHVRLAAASCPFAEAAEQTVLQKVVPFERQGRVFGFAQSVEHGGVAAHGVPHRPDRPVRRHPVHDHRGGRRAHRRLVRHRARARPGAGLHRRRRSSAWWSRSLAFRTPSYRRLSARYLGDGRRGRVDRVPRSGGLLTRPGGPAPRAVTRACGGLVRLLDDGRHLRTVPPRGERTVSMSIGSRCGYPGRSSAAARPPSSSPDARPPCSSGSARCSGRRPRPPPSALGTAAPFAVLASGAVTGSGTSSVTGDVGGSAVTGLEQPGQRHDHDVGRHPHAGPRGPRTRPTTPSPPPR